MGYETILLDADMTLWDFEASERCALRDVTESLGLELTPEREQHYSKVNADLWHRFDLKEITREDIGHNRFADYLEFLGAQGDPVAMNAMYARQLGEYSIMLPGALELCRRLAEHCTLYIVTNGMHDAQTGRFEKCTMKPYIREMFISADMGCQKPEKEFFDKVLAAIGPVDRRKTVIVGDSLTSDMQGGLNAQLDTIWYNPHHKPADPKIPVTWEANSMEAIGDIILGD